MRLSDSRYESIKNDVANLYKCLNITKLPIDPFEICEKMNIKLVKYSDYDEEKRKDLIRIQPQGFNIAGPIIYYNDMQMLQKVKFTILHEIGHIIRGHKERSPLAEAEAEWFAAYAIAPPPVINLFKVSDFTDIVDIFDISFDCACHSMTRYLSWKKFARKDADYDTILMQLFSGN